MSSLFYEDLPVGHVQETRGRTLTEADLTLFAGLSGDYHPLHTDEQYASQSSFGRRILHGPLGIAVTVGLINREGLLDAAALALLGIEWKFTAPVYPGDTVRARVVVIERWLTKRAESGVVVREISVRNQENQEVQKGRMTLLVRCRTTEAASEVGITADRLAEGLRPGLRVGAVGEKRRPITHEITAEGMGSGAPVVATPWVIASMEQAAASVIRPFLPEGYITVGVLVEMEHLGAAYIGEELVARAELIGMAGRRCTFRTEVYGGGRLISRGRHQNHMVRRDRYATAAAAAVGERTTG